MENPISLKFHINEFDCLYLWFDKYSWNIIHRCVLVKEIPSHGSVTSGEYRTTDFHSEIFNCIGQWSNNNGLSVISNILIY